MALRESKDYYTAAQVKTILGITDGMLYNYIDNGALQRVIPPGKKQGVYRRDQVNQLARDLKVFIVTRSEGKTLFEKATKEDVPACIQIGTASYPNIQQPVTSLETRLAWFNKNPDMYYIVRHGEEIVGYTTIIPMKEEKIKAILENKEYLADVKPEDIEEFAPGKELYVYISTMRTKPGISKTEKRAYGVRLIGGLITTIMEMIKRGVNIKTLYSRSETVDGIRVLKHMGFTEIPSTTYYKNYMLRIEEEGKQLWEKYENTFLRRKSIA